MEGGGGGEGMLWFIVTLEYMSDYLLSYEHSSPNVGTF